MEVLWASPFLRSPVTGTIPTINPLNPHEFHVFHSCQVSYQSQEVTELKAIIEEQVTMGSTHPTFCGYLVLNNLRRLHKGSPTSPWHSEELPPHTMSTTWHHAKQVTCWRTRELLSSGYLQRAACLPWSRWDLTPEHSIQLLGGTRGLRCHSNSRIDLVRNGDPVEPPGQGQLVLLLSQVAFCKLPGRRGGSRSPRFDGGAMIKRRRCFPQWSLLLKDVSSCNFTHGVAWCLVLQNKWHLEALRP